MSRRTTARYILLVALAALVAARPTGRVAVLSRVEACDPSGVVGAESEPARPDGASSGQGSADQGTGARGGSGLRLRTVIGGAMTPVAPRLMTLPTEERIAVIRAYLPHVPPNDAQRAAAYYCPCDVNRDDRVDEQDLAEWARLAADPAHPLHEFADINADGVVDADDVRRLMHELSEPACDPQRLKEERALYCWARQGVNRLTLRQPRTCPSNLDPAMITTIWS